MCSHQKVAFVLSLLCAGSLFAGNVCTWKGGSGKLSDDNWDIAPVSGDLSIASGAKHVVDATEYARDGRSAAIFTFGACADEFTDVDIIGGDSSAYVRKTATKMVFHPCRAGCMLMVR